MNALVRADRRDSWNHRPTPAWLRALQRWGSNSAPDTAAALAFCRRGRGDLGPELLAWRFGLDDTTAQKIAPWLVRHVLLKAAKERLSHSDEVLASAIVDAMRKVRGEKYEAISVQAKRLHIRKSIYQRLRDLAESALLQGVVTALPRFKAALTQDAPEHRVTGEARNG